MAKTPKTPSDPSPAAESRPEGERIAKRLARAGVCSRRDAEALIAEGRVSVNGAVLKTPATLVGADDLVTVDGRPLPEPEATRLWRYHKPEGLVTSARDEKGRETVFDRLPPDMPRVVSVGRLDLTTEGLLLLTNDGELARHLELPATGWIRRYRVRVHGRVEKEMLAALARGIRVEGVDYGPIEAELDREQGSNAWLSLGLKEGKNREVRRVLEHLGLQVTRLIRTAYGPFQLGKLDRGGVEEVPRRVLKDQIPAFFAGRAAPGRRGQAEPDREAVPRAVPSGREPTRAEEKSAREQEEQRPAYPPRRPGPRRPMAEAQAREERGPARAPRSAPPRRGGGEGGYEDAPWARDERPARPRAERAARPDEDRPARPRFGRADREEGVRRPGPAGDRPRPRRDERQDDRRDDRRSGAPERPRPVREGRRRDEDAEAPPRGERAPRGRPRDDAPLPRPRGRSADRGADRAPSDEGRLRRPAEGRPRRPSEGAPPPRRERPEGAPPPGKGRPRGGRAGGGERPADERPGDERPRGKRPGGQRSGGDRPGSDQPRADRPGGDRPRGEKAGGERPKGKRPAGDRPGGPRPGPRSGGGGRGADRRR
jgi:23S rRNA pseudouridine2605 synthase